MLAIRQCSAKVISHIIPAVNPLKTSTGIRTFKRWVAPTLRELKRRQTRAIPVVDRRTTYLEWNYDAEVFSFGKRLGENFKQDVLKRALTHRSYVTMQEPQELDAEEDNLEMIENGDKILSKNIVGFLEKEKYPAVLIDSVSKYLLSEDILAQVASSIGLKDLILTSEYPVEKITLANTFKAVICALELSSNSETTQKFVNDFLIAQLNQKDIYETLPLDNTYETMLDLAKTKGISDIEPRLCNESGVNTILANYQVGLYSKRKLLGIGWGESIQIAKETAALDAIQRFHKSV